MVHSCLSSKPALETSLSKLDWQPWASSKVDRAQTENVDAIIVGTSSNNDDVKTAAEAYNIPNLHCSGGPERD